MKYLMYLSFFFLLPVLIPAQKVLVSEEVSIRETIAYYLLDDQRGNVLLFHDQATKFEVHGYDKRLNKKWEKEIELDKKRPEVTDVASVEGDFCVFYTFRNRGKYVLKAHRYNPAADLVDSVTVKKFGSVFYKPNMEVEYSEDERIALLWSIENQDKLTVIAFHMGAE